MILRFATYILIPGLVFLAAPFVAGWSFVAHPAPWVGFVLGFVTMASQPPLSPKALVTDPSDRRTALLILLAVVAANLASVLQFSWRDHVTPAPGSAWVIVGMMIAISGMFVRLWAIRTLGSFFTSAVMVQEGQRVLATGPYRWVRHPSYTGSILTVIGTALALGSPLGVLLAAGVAGPVYLYRIHVEERTLLAGLGEAYGAYRARTPRAHTGRARWLVTGWCT